MTRTPELAALLAERGAISRIAKACGVTHSAVSQWRRVPSQHALTVAREMGVPVERVLPSREPQAGAA